MRLALFIARFNDHCRVVPSLCTYFTDGYYVYSLCIACSTRIRKLTNMAKLESFIHCLRELGHTDLLRIARRRYSDLK